MTDGQTEELYTEKAAARIAGVHPRTIRRWRQLHWIDHVVLPSGGIRYTFDQITKPLTPPRTNLRPGR